MSLGPLDDMMFGMVRPQSSSSPAPVLFGRGLAYYNQIPFNVGCYLGGLGVIPVHRSIHDVDSYVVEGKDLDSYVVAESSLDSYLVESAT